jgi:alginate O-acetyltransferase complex protein AlgI
MLFNSLPFLYVFLPVTYFVFWRLRSKNQRYIWLAITGYIFYSFWNYKFCALMAASTLVSYFAGLGFLKYQDARIRKRLLVLPVVFDLAMLGVFKYANFTLASAKSLAETLHLSFHPPVLDIILPVGISFYTFHTITYIVDSYRGVIVPTRNPFEFACYVSLFPQLVAGPIVRFREIEGDLEHIDRGDSKESLARGWSFFVIGMIKKVLIADTIATIINPALKSWTLLSTAGAWGCMLGYTYQLYFDFSGYSDMAVGLGLMFGLRLPQNFNSPYKAIDVPDFWRRWHISLSSVLRDYLYIPLGGNRKGEARTYWNLILTMLLGGLWHGANWTFVAWGGYHGLLLSAARAGLLPGTKSPAWVGRSLTFLLAVVGWVLFRADDFTMALGLLRRMFLWTSGPAIAGWSLLLILLIIAAALAHMAPNTFELSHQWGAWSTLGLAGLFALCLVVIYGGQQTPFLYFQF